jgi:hypothetical protein
MPSVASRLAVARADDEPIEPSIEAVGIADRADVEPGRDERLLDRVGRNVVVAEDEASCPMETVVRLGGQPREGVLVAAPGPEYEISLHVSSG